MLILSLILANAPAADVSSEQAPPPENERLNIQFLPPGCPDFGSNDIATPIVVYQSLSERDDATGTVGLGDGVLYDGQRWLFPRGNLNQYEATRALVADPDAFDRVVLHYDLPVYIGSHELAFQYPLDGEDWLDGLTAATAARGRLPNMRKTRMRLVQFRRRDDGLRVLALEPRTLSPGTPINPDLVRYTPSRAVRLDIEAEAGDTAVVAIARTVGRGSRIASELLYLTKAHGDALRVHTGSLIDRFQSAEVRSYCADALRRFTPAAVVPGPGELGLGTEALSGFLSAYELPYVAANLERQADGEAPFPPYRLATIGIHTVAFIGIVHEAHLVDLPVPVRKQWRIGPERPALKRTLNALWAEIGRRPDLTVLLVDGRLDSSAIDGLPIDAVVGDFRIDDHRWFNGVTELKPRASGVADASRYELPVTQVSAGRRAVGRLTGVFAYRGEGVPWRLKAIELESYAVLDDGPREAELESQLRELEEQVIADNARVVLADPQTAVDSNPTLESLVYGEALPAQEVFAEYDPQFPPVFTDPLWMRLVTNAMLVQLEVEVALSRNLKRRDETAGRVQYRYVDDWLRTADVVRVYNLTGADLQKVIARMKRQIPNGAIAPLDFVFAAGLDVTSGRVRGRPIDPARRYRIAITDATASLLSAVNFGAYSPDENFVFRNGGAYADEDGMPLLLRDLVLRDIEQRSAETNPVAQRVYLARLLEDRSLIRDMRWSGSVEEASVRGSRYLNNGAVEPLAETLQTRLTTLDNYNFDLRTRLRGTYDGPTLSWDNRLRMELSQLVFDTSTGSDRQEPSDDIVLTSEVRFNSFEADLFSSVLTSPFVQAVVDSEFTPTPNVDEGGDNPRQLLLRGLVGAVAQPGTVLKEVRLSAVFEQDTVNERSVLGLQTSYELQWPLTDELTWESNLEARYFFPDGENDTRASLGLIVQAVNRFLVPVGGLFDIFLYVDLYAARGQIENDTDSIGASWDIGAGIDVARLFTSSRAQTVRSSLLDEIVAGFDE